MLQNSQSRRSWGIPMAELGAATFGLPFGHIVDAFDDIVGGIFEGIICTFLCHDGNSNFFSFKIVRIKALNYNKIL